ncbi:MAG: 2-keto-3-deoxy-galactonokinase, partial [Sulfitobacter sp.]|nr:2-keto-3-deoxy-galactonokinase [Sulfitobacter sp.]
MADRITPDWIALDWGTSNLRGWAMRGSEVLATAQSSDGMGTLERQDFAPALARLVAAWEVDEGTPIIACGMVGARQGWVEAPYRRVPATPLGGEMAIIREGGFSVGVVPGLRQDNPADVM